MHELSVTQSALEIALRYAADAGATRITSLHLVIGDLSSIIDESVQFYWDIISRSTIAEGAVLQFRRVPVTMQCSACGHTYTPARGTLACPGCHSDQVRVIGGDEFRLDAIEIETGSETDRPTKQETED
jgi:hydrogenase nickel incorporation protein HypA/HybF